MNRDLVLIPENPAPPGAEIRWLTAGDGIRLRAVVWPARQDASPARGSVFILAGRAEFAEKYFEVAGELLARGFAVAIMDWRGQGMSQRLLPDPRKGHIGDFSDYQRDLAAFMEGVAPSMPRPFIGLAHSMGGQIALTAAHDHPEWFDALALSAPMLGLQFPLALANILPKAAAFLCRCGLAKSYVPGGGAKSVYELPFAGNILTHDEDRFSRIDKVIEAAPELAVGAPTNGWADAAFRSMTLSAQPAYLKKIQTPVLLAAADEELLVGNEAIRLAAIKLPRCELVSIEDAHHEILMESDAVRKHFWKCFDSFIARRLGPEGSGIN